MRIFVMFIALFLFLVAQTTAFNVTIGHMPWPDFALLLTIYGGLRWGKIGGIQFGATVGLLQDFLSYDTMGIYLCSKAMIGFIIGKLNDEYIHDTSVAKMVLVISATLLDAFIFAFLMNTFLGVNLASSVISSIVPQAIINLAFSFIALPIMTWLDLTIDKLEGKTSEKFVDLKKG